MRRAVFGVYGIHPTTIVGVELLRSLILLVLLETGLVWIAIYFNSGWFDSSMPWLLAALPIIAYLPFGIRLHSRTEKELRAVGAIQSRWSRIWVTTALLETYRGFGIFGVLMVFITPLTMAVFGDRGFIAAPAAWIVGIIWIPAATLIQERISLSIDVSSRAGTALLLALEVLFIFAIVALSSIPGLMTRGRLVVNVVLGLVAVVWTIVWSRLQGRKNRGNAG